MLALTRAVSPTLEQCQLSHRARVPIDIDLAVRQHTTYEAVLEDAGYRIVRVPPAPELPDAVFVEDTAVVFDDVAVVARPGAASRRAEVAAVASVLVEHRPLVRIEAPGTLDGGDVLRIGDRVFVGGSQRTNAAGLEQLRSALEPRGYTVESVPVSGCLHLKTGVTALADDVVLLNPAWVDAARFQPYRVVEVAPEEPFAANVLRLGDGLLMAAGHPVTAERVASLGADVRTVEISELAKAEAGVTCCSVLVGG